MAASPPDSVAPVLATMPQPRSPPKYPDICGRDRLQAGVQILGCEILLLEEELQSLEDAQPVSICCKEVDEFVRTNADPLTPHIMKKHKSCSFLKLIRSSLCCGGFSWLRISCPCSLHLKKPRKCAFDRSNGGCGFRHWHRRLNCSKKCCTYPRCNFPRFACTGCSCGCVCYCCPDCTEHESCCCAKPCCSSHCLC